MAAAALGGRVPRPRARYTKVLGRRYVLIRPVTLLPTLAVDLIGAVLTPFFRRRRPSRPVRRILAIRLDHIGDVLITTPALRLLRDICPEARLDVLAGSWAADLLRDDPDVDRVLTFDASWYGGEASPRDVLDLIGRLRRERYDLVLDFRGDLRHLLLARLIGADRVYGHGHRGGSFLLSKVVDYDEGAHEVDRALALVRALPGAGVAADPGGLKIVLQAPDEAAAARLFAAAGVDSGRLIVALCPASRNRSRWWQGSKFAAVARHLCERYDAQILVFSGDAAAEAADPILAEQLDSVHSFIGQTSLPFFAAALALVDLIVSVESSPIHFASALEKPIVTVFGGSSLPEQWGPYRTDHRIVHRAVACSPCHLLRCPLPEVLCMEAIGAADVTAACDELLAELARRQPALEAKLGR